MENSNENKMLQNECKRKVTKILPGIIILCMFSNSQYNSSRRNREQSTSWQQGSVFIFSANNGVWIRTLLIITISHQPLLSQGRWVGVVWSIHSISLIFIEIHLSRGSISNKLRDSVCYAYLNIVCISNLDWFCLPLAFMLRNQSFNTAH